MAVNIVCTGGMTQAGAFKVGTSAFVANGTKAATFTATSAPTAAATAIQRWLQVTDSAGTSSYIPCF